MHKLICTHTCTHTHTHTHTHAHAYTFFRSLARSHARVRSLFQSHTHTCNDKHDRNSRRAPFYLTACAPFGYLYHDLYYQLYHTHASIIQGTHMCIFPHKSKTRALSHRHSACTLLAPWLPRALPFFRSFFPLSFSLSVSHIHTYTHTTGS